jgi:hypothetical protein
VTVALEEREHVAAKRDLDAIRDRHAIDNGRRSRTTRMRETHPVSPAAPASDSDRPARPISDGGIDEDDALGRVHVFRENRIS